MNIGIMSSCDYVIKAWRHNWVHFAGTVWRVSTSLRPRPLNAPVVVTRSYTSRPTRPKAST